jgi:hypothetical protein
MSLKLSSTGSNLDGAKVENDARRNESQQLVVLNAANPSPRGVRILQY